MALLPSTTLLYAHALSLLVISYFLLLSPLPLLTSPSLLILGEAMHIRPASFQPSPSRLSKGLTTLSTQSTELLAIIGVLLIGYAVVETLFAIHLGIPSLLQNQNQSQSQTPTTTTTTTTTTSPKSNRARTAESLSILTTSQSTHLTLAFIHIIFNGLLCSWIYIFHSTRSLQSQSFLSSRPISSSGGLSSLGNILGNQVIFSAALMDMLFWGYLWTVIRDERREVLERVQRVKGEGVDGEEDD